MNHQMRGLDDDEMLFRVIVVYDYVSGQGKKNEMSLEEGEVIEVVERVNDAWWYGRITDKTGSIVKQGVFPASHVKIIENDSDQEGSIKSGGAESTSMSDTELRSSSVISFISRSPSRLSDRTPSQESPPPAFIDLGTGPHPEDTLSGATVDSTVPHFSSDKEPEMEDVESEDQKAFVFHEVYAYPDGDMVLESSNGTLFRIHSLIMKLCSSYFQELLKKPQPRNTAWIGPIAVEEDDQALLALLDLIYPNRVFQLDSSTSFDLYKIVCCSAEKYGMSSAVFTLRRLSTTALQFFSPIQVYSVATKLGWEEEAKVASTATLGRFIYSSESQAQLVTCEPQALLQLVTLHRQRRVKLLEQLSYESISSPGIWKDLKRRNANCGHTETCICISKSTWVNFLYKVSIEIESCPDGRRLKIQPFYDDPDFTKLFDGEPDIQKQKFSFPLPTKSTTIPSPNVNVQQPLGPVFTGFASFASPPIAQPTSVVCGLDKRCLMKLVTDKINSLPSCI